MSAFQELKTLKQGKETVGEFPPRILETLQRARIFPDDLQLDFFKDRIRPELREAVAYGRAKNISEAIEIATDYEKDVSRRKTIFISTLITESSTYTASSSGSLVSPGTGEMAAQQNYQGRSFRKGGKDNIRSKDKKENRCFRCHKQGHRKADCRSSTRTFTNDEKKYDHNNQHAEESQEEAEEPNIFEHYLSNPQEEAKTSFMGTGVTNRFHTQVKVDGCNQPVTSLVDMGSTISTMVEDATEKLGLQPFACKPITIRYGNKSTQVSTKKAEFKFSLDDVPTRAIVYVVPRQNEEIIFGMDWMTSENIVLHAKNKTIKKIKQDHLETNYSMNVVEDMIQTKYQNPIEESKYQTISNAPYAHRIDTGDAMPIASRDYRRSHAENIAIQKEFNKMLEKKAIVPSNSDWCSPVVLIKKPDDSFRFCIDYRKLDSVTIKDKYPLPKIAVILDNLQGSKIFNSIELKSGYWQLPMEPKDRKNTAFIANGALYEFTCLPFGVVNCPSSFMRFMHYVLR